MKSSAIWNNYFDVVILPPPAIRDHAITLSKELRTHGGEFALGRRRFLPHISLYHIPVRPRVFDAFLRTIREVAGKSTGGVVQLKSIDMPLLMTDRPQWLKRLQRDIVSEAVKYFDWDYGVERLWKLEPISPKLREAAGRNLKKYGSPMMGPLFRPHITLTSFGDRAMPQVRVPFESLSFQVETIAVCELGPHHSCQRKIREYRLAI